MAFLTKKGPSRDPVDRKKLESAIVDGVRKSDPDCEHFIGVVIERTALAAATSNWAIRGVKFGRADREKSNRALKSIVERMQLEFVLSEETARTGSEKNSPAK